MKLRTMVIEFPSGLKASLDIYGWKCGGDDLVESVLNTLYPYPPQREDDDFSYDPDKLYTVAKRAADRIGVMLVEAPMVDAPPGTIF